MARKACFSCYNCGSDPIKGYDIGHFGLTHLFLPQVLMDTQDSVSCIYFILWFKEQDTDSQPCKIQIADERELRRKHILQQNEEWGQMKNVQIHLKEQN